MDKKVGKGDLRLSSPTVIHENGVRLRNLHSCERDPQDTSYSFPFDLSGPENGWSCSLVQVTFFPTVGTNPSSK